MNTTTYEFDPTYGYSLDSLLRVTPPPAVGDLAEFWQDTFAATMDVPLLITREILPCTIPGFDLSLLNYTGFSGHRLGAWLVEPQRPITPDTRYVVVGHGYYNRPIEDIYYDRNTIALFPASRGLGLSRGGGISDQTAMHVLHGIESRETYVHRGCAADVWTAASVMLHVHSEAQGRLEYHGQSFGGGIGAMALPWDTRYVRAELDIPSFGNHPLRVTLPCVGSGEAVRRKYLRHPEVLDVLRYFDAAVHATRIQIPVHMSCALFDPSVPPPGQFCVYNALTCNKAIHVRPAAHCEHDAASKDEDARAESIKAFRDQTT